MNKNLMLNTFKIKSNDIPVWFLRQSGRHIPEYYEIRSKKRNFINFCLDENLIYESTMLPLKYYDLDAVIIFSDILIVPWAIERNVKFFKGIGPKLEPLLPGTKLIENLNIKNKLSPLSNSITNIRKKLVTSKSIIGFAGAPWTLACYMIDGQSSKDFIETRKAVWGSNKWFRKLLNCLTIYVTDILELQAKAGADILMIFDSWSHMIPNNFFQVCAIDPTANIIKDLKFRGVKCPIIGLPFKAGSSLIKYSYESTVDCIALDWTIDLSWADKNLNKDLTIQGNLDPASLIPNKSDLLKDNVLSILNKMNDRRFIFNVGHGLTPDCKISNVKSVIEIVKNYRMKESNCITI